MEGRKVKQEGFGGLSVIGEIYFETELHSKKIFFESYGYSSLIL